MVEKSYMETHRQERTSVPHGRSFCWVTREPNQHPQDIPLLFLPRHSRRVMTRQLKYSQQAHQAQKLYTGDVLPQTIISDDIEEMSLNLQPVPILFPGHLLPDTMTQTPVWPSTATSIFLEPKQSLQLIFSRTFGLLNASVKAWYPQRTSVIIQNALNRNNNPAGVFWFQKRLGRMFLHR